MDYVSLSHQTWAASPPGRLGMKLQAEAQAGFHILLRQGLVWRPVAQSDGTCNIFFFSDLKSCWLELSHFPNIFIAQLPFSLFPYLNSNLSPNPYFSTFTHITAFNFKYCSDIFGMCFLFLSPMEAVYSHMPLTHSFPSRPLPGIR